MTEVIITSCDRFLLLSLPHYPFDIIFVDIFLYTHLSHILMNQYSYYATERLSLNC